MLEEWKSTDLCSDNRYMSTNQTEEQTLLGIHHSAPFYLIKVGARKISTWNIRFIENSKIKLLTNNQQDK